jgi:hypothetical protein
MHHPIEERNLKQPGNDDTSRRLRRMYKEAINIRKDVFLNENIITVKKDNKSFLDDEDYQEVIAETAKNVSLNISAILELAHTKIGDVPYSLEAALLSSSHIRFHTGVDGYACDYQIFCECRKENIYNNETAPFPMDKAMMVLPDAIFCHKFMAILGKEKIGQYLFDKDFEVTGRNMCTDCIPYPDTCIDCCIGNDQQILDALSSNKSFKVCIQETLDIVDAFFRAIPMPKRNNPSLKETFLPLEQMMRFKLYSSLKEPFQIHLLASWEFFLQTPAEHYFLTAAIISTYLPLQLTLNHQPIKKKLKPGIDHDYLLLWFVGFFTKVDWSITDGFDDVPLLPPNNNFQALENMIGHGKPLGPLLHFLGLLPYIMNSKTQNNCPL